MTKEVAGLAPHIRTVADGQEIFPGVRMRITAGHTHGHAEYVMTSGGQRLIAFGDAMHSPIQGDHPEWSAVFDHDPVRSAAHRRRLVAHIIGKSYPCPGRNRIPPTEGSELARCARPQR
ncbi:MBL fold metallo-hydrolase [Actinomadura sp. 9N407]|uniref:MBL fold metallo-hydrolase n=1 Tax=Actinomadura sp. 9N407 TaxID=3375154 RepID=UPI0037BC2716